MSCRGRGAEAKRVQQRHRSRAHGEDITQNTANACRRALIRLDERGVVVAFDLEDGGKPVTNIDGTGILARSLDDLWPVGRQGLQPSL